MSCIDADDSIQIGNDRVLRGRSKKNPPRAKIFSPQAVESELWSIGWAANSDLIYCSCLTNDGGPSQPLLAPVWIEETEDGEDLSEPPSEE
jgi:hypothetical protein